MSLRSRILSRASPAADGAVLLPKDRGTTSAFGLRRTEAPPQQQEAEDVVAPKRESTEEPQEAQPLRRESDPEDAQDEAVDRHAVAPARTGGPAPAPAAALRQEEVAARETSAQEENEPEAQRSTVAYRAQPALKLPQTESPRPQTEQSPPSSIFRSTTEAEPDDMPAEELRHEPPPQAMAHRSIATAIDAASAMPAANPQARPAQSHGSTRPDVTSPPQLQHVATPPEHATHSTPPAPQPVEPSGQTPDTEPPVPAADAVAYVPPPQLATGAPQAAERPKVVIDQIDVVIAEPQSTRRQSASGQSSASALLARRWLRR